MKKPTAFRLLISILALSMLALSSIAQATSIAFKNPELRELKDISAYELQLALNSQTTAVVLGAGPAGFLAALNLKQHGFKQVFIIEKRDTFSRYNTVALRSETFPILRKLEILDQIISVGIVSHKAHVYRENEGKILTGKIPDFQALSLLPTNYSLPVAEIFKNPEVPNFAIELSQMQYALNQVIQDQDGIFLLHGSAQIIADSETLKSIRFYSEDRAKMPDLSILKPNLIVVAEGSRSVTRANVGIISAPVKEENHWCSGSISLRTISFTTDTPPGHICIIRNLEKFIFGVINPHTLEMIVNGTMMGFKDINECVKKSAFEILEKEREHVGITGLPKTADQLILTNSRPSQIRYNKSSHFTHADNIILLGDSAGNGSPIGGIGASLVASVYMEALSTLASALMGGPTIEQRKAALDRYAERVSEIVDFWTLPVR